MGSEKGPDRGGWANGDAQIGRYKLRRRLAVGGMAEVFLARSVGIEGFSKDVVIKRILPQYGKHKEMIEMFLDEARIAGRLRHPNIAQVFDIGESEGEYFFAMEYVEGQDVGALLRRCHADGILLPIEHAVGITIATAAGLEHAHHLKDDLGESLDVVHRDISPSNVMIAYDGTVKLVDFGIAKARERVHVTTVGGIKGKFAYMSPEQHRGEEVDRRSDIFALGILLYEMATTRPLFVPTSPHRSREMIMSGEYQPPSSFRSDFPDGLERIIMRAIQFEPANRYQEAGEMLFALESFARNGRLPVSTSGLGAYMRAQFGVDESPPNANVVEPEAPSLVVSGLSDTLVRGTEASLGPPVAGMARASLDGWDTETSSTTAIGGEQMMGDSLIGTVVATRYRVLEEIGHSTVGTVYKALQQPLGRDVALTLLSSGTGAHTRDLFYRRARAAARLHHHNIATLYDFGEDARWLFLATEYVEGTPLQDLMSEVGAMPWQRAVGLAAQIARGLSAAEREGIVHQNIKPAHLVVRESSEGEEVKILHFGLSRIGHGMVSDDAYMSPEQAKGESGNVCSDLYSLGIVLFEMLAGRHPFGADGLEELAVARTRYDARSLSDVVQGVPSGLCGLVDQMLSKAPSDRPKDASALLQALTAAAKQGDHTAGDWSISSLNDGAPTERVTLVFSQVEGLANLWTRPPQVVRHALDLKRSVLRETLRASGGYELKAQGEAFRAAFASELRAVRWCLDVQRALLQQAWPEEISGAWRDDREPDAQTRMPGLRIRMGAEVGRPECRRDAATGRMDYFGPLVAKTTAIEMAAHGGQILVSAMIADALRETLEPYGAKLAPCDQPPEQGTEALVEVVDVSRQRKSFPTPRSRAIESRSNLVLDQGEFIGRSEERASIGARLASGARIVTLLGSGGSGKTRLAKAIAHDMLAKDEGLRELWFCDISSVTNEMELATLVAGVLSVPLCHGEAVGNGVELVGRSLRRRGRVLLVADNVEQVAAAAALTLTLWLQLAPELQVLVTSREALGLIGEERMEMVPLNQREGCDLFAARVKELGLPPSEDASALADLVVALDGIPLAIELAAGRAGLMTPTQILARMGHRFDILRGTRRGVSARQLTLHGAIDWSWDLLSAAERDAFTQLAVFEGGVALETVESVVELADHADAQSLLDVAQGLKDKSMLRAEPSPTHEVRFSMLQSMREYALEKLAETDDGGDAVRRRHAEHFVVEGKRYAKATKSKDRRDALAWLASNRRNLLAAIENVREKDPAIAAAATLVLDPLYAELDPTDAHRALLDEGIALARRAVEAIVIVEALLCRADLEQERGNAELALKFVEEARALAEPYSASVLYALALVRKGGILRRLGRMDDSAAALDAAEPLARALGASALVARILSLRGLIAIARGDDMSDFLSSAVQLARRSGDRSLEARLLGNQGVGFIVTGNMLEALDAAESALRIHVENDSRGLEGMSMGNLGVVNLALHRPKIAEQWLRKAIAIHRELGNALLEGSDLSNLAFTLLYRSRYRESLAVAQQALPLLVTANGIREQFSCRCALVSAYASINEVDSAREMMAQASERQASFWKLQERLLVLAGAHLKLAEARVRGDKQDAPALGQVREIHERIRGIDDNLYLSAITLGEVLAAYPATPSDLSAGA